MLGISAFGLFHTAVSLVSLALGLSYLVRRRDIRWGTGLGKSYVAWTAAASITGLFIFRHGGFNEAHVLSIVTLLTLAAAIAAERDATPGSWRDCFAALAFSLTVFFHFIPGFNETLVRLPVDAPYITGPDDPKLGALVGGTFLVFLVIAALQLRRLRRTRIIAAAPSPA
jgi:uncharacterized membrane protein